MSKASASDLQWRILKFNELSARLLYRIMAARQAVFVVEQQCAYQDLDGLDECAVHVCALAAGKLYAYARILPPQKRFEEPSIGRVLTVQTARGAGLGRTLMQRCISVAGMHYPDLPLRISAQVHLARFYSSLGFAADGEPYDEDGIAHVDMLRPAGLQQRQR